MRGSIEVLIVDDHFLVRKGIQALVAETNDIVVVGEASDGREAVEQALVLDPDVVLMDLFMPCMGGVEATRRILGHGSGGVRVLVLTGFLYADSEIFAAAQAGATGFIAKSSSREELLHVIRRVHQGEAWLPPELARRLLENVPPAAQRIDSLTRREIEVLYLVAHGASNQEVADRIGIAETTARGHVSHVLRKLGLKSRVEATLFALRNGLASLAQESGPARP